MIELSIYKCECCGKIIKRSNEIAQAHENKCYETKNILDK